MLGVHALYLPVITITINIAAYLGLHASYGVALSWIVYSMAALSGAANPRATQYSH